MNDTNEEELSRRSFFTSYLHAKEEYAWKKNENGKTDTIYNRRKWLKWNHCRLFSLSMHSILLMSRQNRRREKLKGDRGIQTVNIVVAHGIHRHKILNASS